MTPTDRPVVSVVIVHFNGAGLLAACLESVFAQPYRPIQVILVDNGSTDDSLAMVRERFPEVLVSAEDRNLGYAEGNNRGVARATGEFVVLLNNDTVVTPGWIPGLLDAMADPVVGVVTSKVITDGVPTAYYAMNGSLNPLGYNIMRVFVDLSRVFFAGGASLMFRRREIERPFLPEFFLYHEDVYLSWHLRLLGREVRMAQDSLVHHRGSQTTRTQTSAFVTFHQERNRLLNALLLYEARTVFALLPLIAVEGAVKLLWSLLGGRKSPAGILRSYAWIIAHHRWISQTRRRHQQERRVPDAEILRWMSSRLVEGEGHAARAINACARTYLRSVGIRCHD